MNAAIIFVRTWLDSGPPAPPEKLSKCDKYVRRHDILGLRPPSRAGTGGPAGAVRSLAAWRSDDATVKT